MVHRRLAIIVPWGGQRDLVPALAALTGLNQAAMLTGIQQGRPLPLLYQSGVRYEKEPQASAACIPCWNPSANGGATVTEQWVTAPLIVEAGLGDCEDLACMRAAELRLAGEIGAQAIAQPNGYGGFHIVVRRANGQIEDPSKLLGM